LTSEQNESITAGCKLLAARQPQKASRNGQQAAAAPTFISDLTASCCCHFSLGISRCLLAVERERENNNIFSLSKGRIGRRREVPPALPAAIFRALAPDYS